MKRLRARVRGRVRGSDESLNATGKALKESEKVKTWRLMVDRTCSANSRTSPHHVSDLVDALDLSAFYAPHEGAGRRNSPYDPQMMVKVLVYYGYAPGTFSSRKLATKLVGNIAFRMLAAGNFPQHRALCEFSPAAS